MDKGTVLDYPDLPAERLLYWQKRAFREWAFRPARLSPILRCCCTIGRRMKTALNVGLQHLFWASSDEGAPVGGAG